MIDLRGYKTAKLAFEKAMSQLQKDTDYLSKQAKTSKPFISKQNRIIDNLNVYYAETETTIADLTIEIQSLSNSGNELEKKLKDTKLSFESVCIIHGVTNFAHLMNEPPYLLFEEALYCLKRGHFRLPLGIREWIHNLPSEEQYQIESIIKRGLQKQIDKEIEELKNSNL